MVIVKHWFRGQKPSATSPLHKDGAIPLPAIADPSFSFPMVLTGLDDSAVTQSCTHPDDKLVVQIAPTSLTPSLRGKKLRAEVTIY